MVINIRNRILQHTCTTIATYATSWSIFATSAWNTCNIPLKHLKHMLATCDFSTMSPCYLDEWTLVVVELEAGADVSGGAWSSLMQQWHGPLVILQCLLSAQMWPHCCYCSVATRSTIVVRRHPLAGDRARLKCPKWREEGWIAYFKISTTTLRQLVSQLNGEVNFALAVQVLQATYPQF
jgi:hypothetical protein